MDSRQIKAIVIAGLFGIFLIIAILCVYLTSPKEKAEEKPVAQVNVQEKVHTGEEQIEDETAYISEVVATKKE